MKDFIYIVIVAILAVLGIISIEYNSDNHKFIPWHATEARIRDDVTELSYHGHDYLMYYRGGIIHSESCPCKTNKIIFELPSSRVNATQ